MEFYYKFVATLLFLFLSFLKPSSSLFPPLPMYGYMITTSWYDDFLRSNQGRDHQAGQNEENTCSLCNNIVQGGIEALHVHYLASHEVTATQMAAQDPNRPSSSSQPFPLPAPTNLTQLPSVSASTSNPNNPAPGSTQSQTPPFLYNPDLRAAGPSHSSNIIPPRRQDQVIINNNNNNNGNAPQQNPPPLIQYVRRRRRGNAQPNNYQNPWLLATSQPAQDVIDMGSDFEDGSTDGEDVDFIFGLQ